MPSYGQPVTLQYLALNTSTNVGQTGDVANHTLRWVKDGVSAAPANSPVEVDAVNAPGVYQVTLVTAEASCQSGTLAGKSSTANVNIIPRMITFENLPTESPSAAGGLLTVGTGPGQITPNNGNVPLDGTQAVPTTSNTPNSVFDCLNAARADGFGKWVLSGNTVTLYAPDGVTAVRTFTVDSPTAPTQRS